jgi:hypothetical protein
LLHSFAMASSQLAKPDPSSRKIQGNCIPNN